MDFTKTALGLELGSTRIKAVLLDEDRKIAASGSHDWENKLENGIWTYSLDDILNGVKSCYASLAADVKEKFGKPLETVGAISDETFAVNGVERRIADNLAPEFYCKGPMLLLLSAAWTCANGRASRWYHTNRCDPPMKAENG